MLLRRQKIQWSRTPARVAEKANPGAVPTLRPSVSLSLDSPRPFQLLTAMPFQTTSLLPLTVPPSVDSLTLPTSVSSQPNGGIAAHQHHHHLPLPSSASAVNPPALTASTGKTTSSAPASRSSNHARRYTLSRFPLLRKGSRELNRTPSTHLRGSGSQTPSPTDSPFTPSGAPRASLSATRRPENISTRESTCDSHEVDVICEEAELKTLSDDLSADHTDKMHQTSSRLLRMTDDERPFTRVSFTAFTFVFFCSPDGNDGDRGLPLTMWGRLHSAASI